MDNVKILTNLINNCNSYPDRGMISEDFVRESMKTWGIYFVEEQVNPDELYISDDLYRFTDEISNRLTEFTPFEEFGLSKEKLNTMDDVERMDILIDSGYATANELNEYDLVEKLNEIGLILYTS